jgi:thymidylate synthase ThyX
MTIINYNSDLGIASVSYEYLPIKVSTILSNPGKKQPAINAFLAARYSRSADSVEDIAAEVQSNKKGAAERLANIYGNYGHSSVADLANITIFIENIPMFLAFKIFNMVPVHAGQERSTRYQDFAKRSYVSLPPDLVGTEIADEFYATINNLLDGYDSLYSATFCSLNNYFGNENLKVVESRTFDTLRYLLPIGLNTSMSLTLSAREASELCTNLEECGYIAEQVASLIASLLTGSLEFTKLGYVPEVNDLFKYRRKEKVNNLITSKILSLIKLKINPFQIPNPNLYEPTVYYDDSQHSIDHRTLLNYARLQYPNLKTFTTKFTEEVQLLKWIGELHSTYFSHHYRPGNITKSSDYTLNGYCDLGSLRDINRHRSLVRQIPILHSLVNMDIELDRPLENLYSLCPYLQIPEFALLRQKYEQVLDESYTFIKLWYENAKKKQSPEFASEYVKYLLPLAHSTTYSLSGDYDSFVYFVNLRIRPGGHIAYRLMAEKIAKLLSEESYIAKEYFKYLSTVIVKDKKDFFDRS